MTKKNKEKRRKEKNRKIKERRFKKTQPPLTNPPRELLWWETASTWEQIWFPLAMLALVAGPPLLLAAMIVHFFHFPGGK